MRAVRTHGKLSSLRACLLGEELEQRCVPAFIYRWAPPVGTGTQPLAIDTIWDKAGSWERWDAAVQQWDETDAFPGAEDTAFFSGVKNFKCVIEDLAIVSQVVIVDGYTSTIELQDNLIISGTGLDCGIWFDSPATIASASAPEPKIGLILAERLGSLGVLGLY